MKSFIISLVLIFSVYCSLDSCVSEQNYSNCTNHEIELKQFSCYKFWNSEGGNDNKKCFPFPNESKDQGYFWALLMGNTAEFESVFPGSSQYYFSPILTFIAERDEVHAFPINGTMPFDYIEIIRNHNTCFYQYYGRYYKTSNSENITDKNICYNVDQYTALKNKVNCGYGEIKYVKNGKTYGIKSCFFVPNKTMSVDMRKMYKKYFIDKIFEKGYFPLDSNSNSDGRLDNNTKMDYEIIIEDKDSQKVKCTYDSDDFEYIENNDKSESDFSTDTVTDDSTDDEPQKIFIPSSKGNRFMFDKLLLLLFFMLML